jgi:hypothetical protein
MLPLKLELLEVPEGLPVQLQKLGYFMELPVGGRNPFVLGSVMFHEDGSVSFAIDVPWTDKVHFYRLVVHIYKDGKVRIQ